VSQLSLDDELAEHKGLSFGEWVEALPPDPHCAECRWAPSCRRDGCWRQECEQTGWPLHGVGPSARGAA
jgi:hypothetical protein